MSAGPEHDDNAGLQELMNSFDDIPRMMSNMQKVDKDAYTLCAGYNQSIEMESAMRMFEPVSCQSSASKNKISRMATQAQKVMDHLAKIPGSIGSRDPRSVNEMSTIATAKLQKVEENGQPLDNFFSLYDVNKSGKVTYNDFTDSLLAVSSGLRKDEAEALAKSLDTSKSGTIDYKNILGALKQIGETNPPVHPPKAKANPLPATYLESPLRRFNKMTIQLSQKNDEDAAEAASPAHRRTVSDTVNIVEPLSPEMQSAYEREYQDSSSSRLFSTDFSHPQRRYYGHTNLDKPSTTQNAPFSTDLNADEIKSRRRHRRSSSTPLDASMIAMQMGDFINGQSIPPASPLNHQQSNLRNTLQMQQTTPSKKAPAKTNYPDVKAVRQQRSFALSSRTTPHNSINGENALISELGPKANSLKHFLNEFDTSRTGSVTADEFRKAVSKAGLSLKSDQVKDLFTSLISEPTLQETASIHHAKTNGYEQGSPNYSLKIDSFIERVKSRTNSSAYRNLVPASGKGDSDLTNEERRVFKKVLYASTKPGCAPLIDHSAGFISKDTLRETMEKNGTNLNSSELNTLMRSTEQLENRQGLIEVIKLDAFLNDKAREALQHQSSHSSKLSDYAQRYSNTFNSSHMDSSLMNTDEIKSSSFHTASIGTGEKKQWKSLQSTFQKNEDRILAAFTDARPGEKDFAKKELSSPVVVCKATPKELTVVQLKAKLKGVGLPLGDEDFHRLERRIAHEESKSSSDVSSEAQKRESRTVSLQKFCDVVGIPMVTDRQDGRLALTHKHANESAGLGSFAASGRSQTANPSFSTSMGVNTSHGMDGTIAFDDAVNGKRLARQTSKPLHAHLTGEPSKWFDLTHSKENKQPLGTFQVHYRSSSTPRGSNIPFAARSDVATAPSPAHSVCSTSEIGSSHKQERGRSHHRRVSSLTQHFNDNDSVASFATANTINTADTSNCTTVDGHSKRSSSAPPRSYVSSPSNTYRPKRFEATNRGYSTPNKQSTLAGYYGLVTPV